MFFQKKTSKLQNNNNAIKANYFRIFPLSVLKYFKIDEAQITNTQKIFLFLKIKKMYWGSTWFSLSYTSNSYSS